MNILLKILFYLTSLASLFSGLLIVQVYASSSVFYESEPNNTPAEANALSGPATIMATMEGGDQDGFMWSVSDVDAQHPWNFELIGIPGAVTQVEFVRITFTDDGQQVASKQALFRFGSRDGARPVQINEVLFEPGDYLIGISRAGGKKKSAGLLATGNLNLSGSKSLEEQSLDTEKLADDFPPQDQYRLLITKGKILKANSPKKNSKDKALKLTTERKYAIYAEDPTNWFSFELSDKQAQQRWEISGLTAIGRTLSVALIDAGGKKLAQIKSDNTGKFSLPDLGLAKGKYLLEFKAKDAGFIQAVSINAVGERIEGDEAEPNNDWKNANRVDLSKPVHGRAGKDKDLDYFRFKLSQEEAGFTQVIKLEGTHGLSYKFCLFNDQNKEMQCRTAMGSVSLLDLSLSPGYYGISVSRSKKGAEYTLSMEQSAPRKAIQEAEPNDKFGFAAALNAKRIVKGRFVGEDTDFYRFTVSGEPQLWRVQAVGDGVSRIALLDSAGRRTQVFNPPAGSRRARMSNLFLLPGVHHVMVKGKDGSYLLRVLPTGPANINTVAEKKGLNEQKIIPTLNPDIEFEPNDDVSRAQILNFGQTRTGLLDSISDKDFYRFLLTNYDHIRLTIHPPVDGQIRSWLSRGNSQIGRNDSATEKSSDKRIVIEGLFPPGDYNVQMATPKPSDTEYQISLERLPRYSCKKDCENAGLSKSTNIDHELPLSLKLVTEVDKVAAYKNYRQNLKASLTLTNTGMEEFTVNLEAITSDYRWQAVLDQQSVQVPAEKSATVPVTINVPRDAWAGFPVRLSLRAYDDSGAQLETYTDIFADAESFSVDPSWDWPLPDEMLGGFNVAWSALGGQRQALTGEDKQGRIPKLGNYFDQMFDNKSEKGKGLLLYAGSKQDEVAFTVDLAGDDPVDVAGFILNPLGYESLDKPLSRFELQLSLDGKVFNKVLNGKLKPFAIDQNFVLGNPVPARFARLIIQSSEEGKSREQMSLGEWKVVARPGTSLSNTKAINIASPDYGGHVVWASPSLRGDWDIGILTEKIDTKHIYVRAAEKIDWVIGFHDDRAARINQIEWVNSKKVKAPEQINKLKVYASIDSPLGPWKLIKDWDRGPDPVTSLKLDEPVWARYVRFSATGPEKRGAVAFPETLRIFEQPAGEKYLSILGEWGIASRDAFYEKMTGLKLVSTADQFSTNNSLETAVLLQNGKVEKGRVSLGRESDWYKVSVPAGMNTLELKLTGDSGVRTVLTLSDSNNKPVALHLSESKQNSHTYRAIVEAGGRYFIKVEEPPRSVIFLWDNSGSVGPYSNMIYNAISSYVRGVKPGVDVANLMVLGRSFLLKNWSGEPFILQSALNDYDRRDANSDAERSLMNATEALDNRVGTRAIILVTDAVTPRHADVWKSLDKVRPRVFTIRVGSTHGYEEDLMQSWANVNNGYADNPQTNGEMDRAFDRAKTMLRQPADYTLKASMTFEEAPGPGLLNVVAKEKGMSGGAVELILDASGSMLKRLNGKRRITIAKEVLSKAVTEIIPAGTPVALRVFGHRKANACKTDLEIKLKPLDPASAKKTISKINAKNLAKTPIADSLAKVESDLRKTKGKKVVILVTDGEETCEGDPTDVLKKLAEKGIDIRLNIVGFAIDDAELKRQFENWAEQGGGKYFDASDEASLNQSVNNALRIPYSVYNLAGELIAEGTVGGEPLQLNAGFYRVNISGAIPRGFEKIEIIGEKEHRLEY